MTRDQSYLVFYTKIVNHCRGEECARFHKIKVSSGIIMIRLSSIHNYWQAHRFNQVKRNRQCAVGDP